MAIASGDWCESQLDAAINGDGGKLANLDNVDKLCDNGRRRDTRAHQQRVVRRCASVQPLYYLRQMRPSRTHRAAAAADEPVPTRL